MSLFARSRQLLLVVLALMLPLSGCVTYKYLPEEPTVDVPMPEALHSRTAQVQSHLVSSSFTYAGNAKFARYQQQAMASWFAPASAQGSDYVFAVAGEDKTSHAGPRLLSLIFGFASYGGLPTVAKVDKTSVMQISSPAGVVFNDTQTAKLRRTFTIWTPLSILGGGRWGMSEPKKSIDHVLAGHRAALVRLYNEQQLAFGSAAERGTAIAFEDYLGKHPASFFHAEALRGLAAWAARAPDPLAEHQRYAAAYPGYVRYLDSGDALWFVGPKDGRVMDLQAALRQGIAPDLLATQIRTAGKPYRNFNNEELGWLKQKGIPDVVVMAMLDATRGGAQAVAAVAPGAATSVMTAPAAAPATLGEKAAGAAGECTKAYLAKKTCEKIPDPTGFGLVTRACIKKVKQTYGGAGCPLL